jgi:hypothetical protein
MSDNTSGDDRKRRKRRIDKDQEELERLAREAAEREKQFNKRRAPPETMPRPGDTSEVRHVPGLG